MTDREEFEKWYALFKNTPLKDEGFVTLTEDIMFSGWQAKGELDAVRIKELEAKLDKVKRTVFLGKSLSEANERYLDELANECSDPNL